MGLTQSEHLHRFGPCPTDETPCQSINARPRPRPVLSSDQLGPYGVWQCACISTSKVPRPAELAESLLWHSPALKKDLEKCRASQSVRGGGNRVRETLALAEDSFHGLLTCPALAVGLGPADWSVVLLVYGKGKVHAFRTRSMGAVVTNVCSWGLCPPAHGFSPTLTGIPCPQVPTSPSGNNS